MTFFYQSEKRQFVRVPTVLPVKYRFVSQNPSDKIGVPKGEFSGETQNLGAGGMLLVASLPSDPELITNLLMQRIIIAVTLELPESSKVRALCRASWIEAIDPAEKTLALGLRFLEITNASRDDLFRFVISACNG